MLGCVYLIGVIYSLTNNNLIVAIGAIFIIVANIRLILLKRWKRAMAGSVMLLAMFLISIKVCDAQIEKRENYLHQVYDGETVTVWGEIYRKEYKNNSYNLYISKAAIDYGDGIVECNDILIYLESDDYSIGDFLKVKGQIKEFSTARNQGEFDMQSFYLSQKIDLAVKARQVDTISMQGYSILGFRYGEYLYRLRNRLLISMEYITDEKNAGILGSMILGDKSLMDADTKNMYQAAGISHVLAISGLHVSIIGAGLYRSLRKRRMSFLNSQLVSNLVIMSYAIMTGNAVSTKRAVCMFILVTLASTVGRSYDLLNSLGIAVIIVLIQNPFAVTYAGFVFSCSAILSIGLVVPVFVNEEIIKETKKETKEETTKKDRIKQMKDDFVASIQGGIGIQLFTLPIVAYYYYEIPTYAIILNALILPLLNILFISGLLGAVAGVWIGGLGRIIIIPASLILKLYEFACGISLKLPFARIIVGQPSLHKLIIYYLILALGIVISGMVNKKGPKYIWVILQIWILLYVPKNGFEIDILDVGQGDGIYISTTENYNLFIDGGSTSKKDLCKYTLLPFVKYKGIRQIDYWFISHADKDHISGILDVLDSGYKVDCFVVSEASLVDEVMPELIEKIEEHNCNIIYMKQKDMIDFGKTTITCVYPGSDTSAINSSCEIDRNDICLSFVYKDGDFTGAFCGDIPSEIEKQIVSDTSLGFLREMLLDVDLYKVNHHGSKYSSSKEWLNVLEPKISVISCGEKNSYGHPAKEALNRLDDIGTDVYITMNTGQICISKENEKLKVWTFCSK